MELETENQINFDYNYFFYATVCHVCKRFGEDVPLKRCGGCKMISYCGKEHQKQHWAQHKPLCKIIQNVLRDGLEDTTSDDWSKTKQILLEAKKKKPFLQSYEMEMFLFPKECAVCYEEDVESLVVCPNCLVSFCKDHKDGIAHTDACEPLKLYFRTCLSSMKEGNINICLYLQHGYDHGFQHLRYVSNTDTKTSNTFQDMDGFINTCWNIEVHSEMNNILTANLSEYLTRPLTLFYAMQVLNYIPERKELVIHVIAAGDIEAITFSAWEVLLHFIKETGVVSLVIIMIGTGLNSKSHSLSMCDNCLSQGRKVSLEFYSVFYEDYVRNPLFVKPDLIVAFNVNIPGDEIESNAEMTLWLMEELPIKTLAKQNCPFLFTCSEQEELEKCPNNINTILNRTVDYLHSGKNPFASLKPNRSLGRKLIVYNNNCTVIYRSGLFITDVRNLNDRYKLKAVFDAEENVGRSAHEMKNTS